MDGKRKELPLYKKVYETLRKNINDHVYKERDVLPSEHELCTLFQATRPTVRKALDRLVHEGYIKKKQGKGSIVIGNPKGVGILSLSGTTSAVGEENLITRIIIKPEFRTWNKAFSFSIREDEQEVGCIYLERLRIMNGQPVFYDITMIPNINLPRFTSRNLENKSLFDTLRTAYQIDVTGGQQRLMAILADEKLQEYFKVPKGHPVLQLDRKIETSRDGFFIYSQVFCNTEEFALFGTF
jgi:DNA-binding GntR family transcriptional regulator